MAEPTAAEIRSQLEKQITALKNEVSRLSKSMCARASERRLPAPHLEIVYPPEHEFAIANLTKQRAARTAYGTAGAI